MDKEALGNEETDDNIDELAVTDFLERQELKLRLRLMRIEENICSDDDLDYLASSVLSGPEFVWEAPASF